MSSSRSDVVTLSVHPSKTLFFFSPKQSYQALKPPTTLSNKSNKTNTTKECTYPSQLPCPTKGLFRFDLDKAVPLEICPKYIHHTDYKLYHQKVTKSSVLRKITTFLQWESPPGKYTPYVKENFSNAFLTFQCIIIQVFIFIFEEMYSILIKEVIN